jgi:hypothetical protein
MKNPEINRHRRTSPNSSRRRFLQTASAAALLANARLLAGATAAAKPKVAAVFTELRLRSHAYNILENFFEPYLFSGQLVDPGCEVASFYADQFPQNDMARDVAKRFRIPLCKTIDEAMCVGGDKLAVDAVLLIGEHGDYPFNDLGQHLYPRKEFFDQCVAPMKRAGRFVPLFNDKHLSYRWDWAKEMYDTARANGMPMLAGSSVPLAERRPPLDLPRDADIEVALAMHGGGREVYDFHGLEVLQSFVEARRGGETGIARVEMLIGDAAVKALDARPKFRELYDAALAAEAKMDAQREPRPPGSMAPPPSPNRPDAAYAGMHLVLVTYRDGLEAAVVKTGNDSSRWDFACRLKGENQPRATALFNGSWGNRCLFKALSHAIQHLFVNKQEPYPLERTLLTTGATEAAMRSLAAGKPLDVPHLAIQYKPVDFAKFRESGASWKRITADTPQPTDFSPGDARLLK